VTTRNNMLGESGESTYRVAPAPLPFDLSRVSREVVMDAHPWTYQVSAAEVRREGRVRKDARPGSKRIPDPRRFTYLEACADMRDATVAFAVGVRGRGGRTEWTWSDAGPLAWRIQRSRDNGENGCFRGAVALPDPHAPVQALRFRAFTRAPRKGEAALPPGAGRASLRAVNRLFRLRNDDTPGPSLFTWTGELALPPDGDAVEIAVSGAPAQGAAGAAGDGSF
jgi:hypothetical protein